MLNLIKNPFHIYIVGFSLSFVVYTLGWSDLYPSISSKMLVFFGVAFFFYFILGTIIAKLKLVQRTPANTKYRVLKNGVWILYLLYLIEFLIEGDIPLISKILGLPSVHYMKFGLPLLHGILISFNSFLIAHSFSMYFSTKTKAILVYNLLLYLPALLFISRSILVLGLLTSLFIYMHHLRVIGFKNLVKLTFILALALYFFGVIGNLRSGGDYIYTQSKATKEFMQSKVPKEFYWTYLYVASPLANFQNTINQQDIEEYNLMGFLFYENMPKIISKNLSNHFDVEERDLNRLTPWLTVGTTYAKSFAYIGWWGPYLLFFGNLLVYLFFLMVIPRKSNYHLTTVAILSVIIMLNIFSNMLIVTGISFQLFYCLIFAYFENKKIVLKS